MKTILSALCVLMALYATARGDSPRFAPVYAVQIQQAAPVMKTAPVYQYYAPVQSQAPTPIVEVRRVLALLNPQANETFIDYGCGDGRWLIEAAGTYGCRAIGIENDSQQVERARRAVSEAGLVGRVQIIEGDVLTANVDAQVGVAYLYPDLLTKLKPTLLRLNRFATPFHAVDGVQMQQNGDTWIWQRSQAVQEQQAYAVYDGQYYTGRVCNSPGCAMCNSIQRQLNSRRRWSN
jgi:SAM-dependent methyltransferase